MSNSSPAASQASVACHNDAWHFVLPVYSAAVLAQAVHQVCDSGFSDPWPGSWSLAVRLNFSWRGLDMPRFDSRLCCRVCKRTLSSGYFPRCHANISQSWACRAVCPLSELSTLGVLGGRIARSTQVIGPTSLLRWASLSRMGASSSKCHCLPLYSDTWTLNL